MTAPPQDQFALVRERVRRARPKPPEGVAAELPVARVAVDVSLAHLDRPFDYLVPEGSADRAAPGARVRVRFAGQLVGGFVLDRVEASEHPGRLARLDRVVSPEPVLAPEVAQLARTVADHYAGTLADVLRLAVPPRHARVEAEPVAARAVEVPVAVPDVGPTWGRYAAGSAFLRAVAAGGSPAAVWCALPGPTWPTELGQSAATALAADRGALIIVPDHRDVGRVSQALTDQLGPGRHVALSADLGPAERYRRWLAVRRGHVRVVVGTRAAMFAPVAGLGLVALWDDGDDLHADPHAPYPHARSVLALRAAQVGAALLVGGLARTAEGQLLLDTGAARAIVAGRATVRSLAPLVRAAGDDAELARDPAARTARLPRLAWETARTGLAAGPVLVQVPRRGYVPALSCGDCRAPARCPACAGPLALTSGHAVPHCGWCGRPAGGWRCPTCEGQRLRAGVTGAGRTAEELGRAFPGVPVRTSGRDGVLATVGPQPQLVVATPGAEPVADGGYAAALLLDGWAMLGRPDLRAGEESLRRWLAAASLVRPAGDGGRVVVAADGVAVPVQGLLRWDPAGAAERELAGRTALRFPPAAVMASLTGPATAVADFLSGVELPGGGAVLGPLPWQAPGRRDAVSTVRAPGEELVRALVRAPRGEAGALAASLKAAQAVRSARKAEDFVTVHMEPLEVG
jgi:primosomal protein N' (replication factor Y)